MFNVKRKYGKSNIRLDARGGYVYQTYTYFGSENGKKVLKQKYVGKVSKSVLETTRKEWDKYFDEMDYVSKNKNPFIKPPQPLTKLVNDWILYNEKQLKLDEISETTLRINRDNIKIFLRWYLNEYSDKQIEAVKTKEINLYKEHRQMLKLSPSTISFNLRPIRTFFKWVLSQKYIEYSPFTSEIKIPKSKVKKDEAVPMGDDWKKLYEFVEASINFEETESEEKRKWDWFNHNDWFKYIVWIMANTAMRGGEVRMLKWKKGKFDSIDKPHPFIYLNKDFTKFHIHFKGSYAELPISKKLNKFFKKLYKNSKDNLGEYVFQSERTNKPYGKDTFSKLFNKLCIGLGLTDDEQKSLYSPHSIRHAVVSDLINKNVNIYRVQKLLRHTDIRTTLNIYGHLLPSDLEEVMEQIGT